MVNCIQADYLPNEAHFENFYYFLLESLDPTANRAYSVSLYQQLGRLSTHLAIKRVYQPNPLGSGLLTGSLDRNVSFQRLIGEDQRVMYHTEGTYLNLWRHSMMTVTGPSY